MAALHDALSALAPVVWADIPQDDISHYVKETLEAGELICNSVPPPSNGTPFGEAKPFSDKINAATSAKEMHASETRPSAPVKEHEDLQSQWGKPMKFSAKDNPLNIAVYKTAGHDRHGAWFARSSIHEGMGFNKFRTAMMREFPQTLKTQGGPGAGAIRGIGADQLLEHVDVDGSASNVQVYQLSAQFPGPTTPREFITLLITSDSALTKKSIGNATHHIPRHFMVISKPVKHDGAPDRPGYIRGQYESVELIREIPLNRSTAGSKSSPNLLNQSQQHAHVQDTDLKRSNSDSAKLEQAFTSQDYDPELNPVEWIMISRSDPGGGIPRFMVERGTPSTMIADVTKFLDWATTINEHSETDSGHGDGDEDSTTSRTALTADQNGKAANVSTERSTLTEDCVEPTSDTQTQPSSMISSIAHTLGAGLDAYAPTMVSSFVHGKLGGPDWRTEHTSDSSDISDAASFESASERRNASMMGAEEQSPSSESASLADTRGDPRKISQHDKELLKIAKDREKLEQKLAKKREEEAERLKKAQQEEEAETSKAQERHDKEMKKQEDKYKKEIEKLEARKAKETKKAEEKKKKQLDRDTLQKVIRERDEFRSQVDLLKRENAILRQQLDSLQPSQHDSSVSKEASKELTA